MILPGPAHHFANRLVRQGMARLAAIQSDMTLVGEASNGREAIHPFRIHHPDVTLMDLQMPGMSGLDAIIAIRGEFAEARIERMIIDQRNPDRTGVAAYGSFCTPSRENFLANQERQVDAEAA